MKNVTITTDGGCHNLTSKLGGWAAILRYGANVRTLSGMDADTTNNRMELTAIIEALRCLKTGCDVTLRTDSMYCIWAIEAADSEKARRRWMLPQKPNRDLVADLWDALTRHRVRCVWVKGHSGDPDNEECDRLAGQRMREARRG